MTSRSWNFPMGPTRAKRPQMPRQLKKRFEPKAATHLHGAGRVDFHFYTRDCCILLKSCRFAYSEAQPPYQELHRGREQGNFFTHTCDIWIQAESWRPPSEHGQIPGEHTGLSFLGKEEKKKKKDRRGGKERRSWGEVQASSQPRQPGTTTSCLPPGTVLCDSPRSRAQAGRTLRHGATAEKAQGRISPRNNGQQPEEGAR